MKRSQLPPTAKSVVQEGGPRLQSVNAALKRAGADFRIKTAWFKGEEPFIWAEPDKDTVHLFKAAQAAYELITGDPCANPKQQVIDELSEALSRIDPLNKAADAKISESEQADECPTCRGYGYFTDSGNPTTDRRCRKCLDCTGSGKKCI